MPRLLLASASPRRRELLGQWGYVFELLAVDVAEVRSGDESPVDYVIRVARDKAMAGRALLAADDPAVVLSADTEVVLDDRVYGKPRDATDATEMLASLSGREHTVLTAVAVAGADRSETVLQTSRVRLAQLEASEIAAYVDSGEAFGKAGAYGIQGRAACLIEHLSGSFSSVMGLPAFETSRLLRRFGIQPV